MSLKHVYYVPQAFAKSSERKEILQLLARVSETLAISYEDRMLRNERDEERLKMTLLPLAVRERLRVHQSAKGKSLYPHLLVFSGGDPVAFFPQIRKEKERKLEVRVSEYLTSLLSGSLKSLVPIPTVEEKVPRKETADEQILKEGYLATADEARQTLTDWSSVESRWPE